jgi:hypothetical protein
MPMINNVVLVHGGFVDGAGWRGVYDILKQDGFNVSIVQNPCYGKVEMSPLSRVEMSPFAESGGGRFERGRFGDERGGAGAV